MPQFLQAVSLAPQNDRAWGSLGSIQTVLGQYKDAEQSLKKAIGIKHTYWAYSNLGSVYMRSRQFEDAVYALNEAAGLNDREYVVFGNLARALYFTGMRERARAEYEHAIRLAQEQFRVNPHDGNVHIMLARYYAALGDRSQARLHVDQALNSEFVRPNFLWHAAVVYNQTGDPEKALSLLAQAVAEGFSKTEIRDTAELDNLRDDARFALRFAQIVAAK